MKETFSSKFNIRGLRLLGSNKYALNNSICCVLSQARERVPKIQNKTISVQDMNIHHQLRP